MSGVRDEIAAARVEIKEINTGLTTRVLNLEANSVSKTAFNALADDVEGLKESRTEYRAQLRNWLLFGGILYGALQLALGIYFHYH
jgi:hypothetical protein